MDALLGRALFFPVFDVAKLRQWLVFHVIGWAAFVIDVGGVDWGSHVKSAHRAIS